MMADADGQAVNEPSRELELVANGEADGLRAWHARACPTTLKLRSHHPDDRALAVGCSNGRIYVYSDYLDPNNWNHQALVPGYDLCPARSPRATGEVLLGHGTWLYASTELDAHGDHWVINTSKRNGKGKGRLCGGHGRPVTDSGDTMALTDDRERLALFTRSRDAKHVLRLYDIKNTNFDAVTTVTLERFPRRSEIALEVTCAKFSPDGCFIAIGRNNNSFHLYNTRMWKEPIHRFQHNISANAQKNRSIGAPNYGVTHFEWVVPPRGGGLGFVSGGGDSCVYLWDMCNAHSARPELLAEMQHGVATFSIGDRQNGEKRLVV
ncbi:unnamed protein product [Peniophora sp. CBMAI 1063]|nr:unnamed protein product [Peniophora sp. CBMAI 1063]